MIGRALFLLATVAFAQTDALQSAVQANDERGVTALLAKGANPNSANSYGITPLWIAATNGSASMARLLLKAGADANGKLPHGETALMAAARTGEPETIQALLKAGSDPNVQEAFQGETALMWAASENHPEAIQALLAGGAKPNLHAKGLDLAPMKWMQVGMVDTLLPRGGFTALMYAARQDAQAGVRALADGGADLDAQDPDGATALQFAIINQHYDMAALLLEKGANPNAADNTGMDSLYAAVDMVYFRSDIGRPTRALPDKLSAMDVVRLILQHHGNPNARLTKAVIGRHHGFGDNSLSAGATVLMRAAKNNDMEVMKLLIDAGANPALGMTNGSNAILLLAATRVTPGPATDKMLAAIRLLAEHGANLNGANKRGGETALHITAKAGSNAIVRLLCELGADPNVKDSSGKTPLDAVTQAGANKLDDTAAILQEFAAKRATQ